MTSCPSRNGCPYINCDHMKFKAIAHEKVLNRLIIVKHFHNVVRMFDCDWSIAYGLMVTIKTFSRGMALSCQLPTIIYGSL